jgi:hypothetical protein
MRTSSSASAASAAETPSGGKPGRTDGGRGAADGAGEGEVDDLACAAHLGRRSLTLRGGGAALRFEWAVSIDWAGDAASSVRASATFPSVCTSCPLLSAPFSLPLSLLFNFDQANKYSGHDADERKALRRAPQAFDLLVKKYGVYNAINTMGRLVFADSDAEGHERST